MKLPEDNADGHTESSKRVLLWRTWVPLHAYPATFSSLEDHSIGGTCSQLLWHARALVAMGYRVQVLGVCHEDIEEEGVRFIGASTEKEQLQAIASGRVEPPDTIFLEGGFAAAPVFRRRFPGAAIVHVGQNLDRYGAAAAFEMSQHIDIYGMVSPGIMSQHCMEQPSLRHKFMLLRNIVPWRDLYEGMNLDEIEVEDKVVWVGAWTKKGLRGWAETMERVLAEFPSLEWELYGPSHGAHVGGVPAHLFAGLDLPRDRITVNDYPLRRLAKALAAARVVLVSLGNETACISALDGHAVARPVLSGNDMVFKSNNPEGTGLRVFRASERYEALTYLLRHPHICDKMGAAGRMFVAEERTERNQHYDLTMILGYRDVLRSRAVPVGFSAPGQVEDTLSYYRDIAHRWWYRAGRRAGKR